MIFCGNYEVEKLVVHPSDDVYESHYVEIAKDKDAPIFSVTCCSDDEWIWEFMYSKTNYEVVKYLIMDSIVQCDTMDELIDMMDEVFEEECGHMLCEGIEYCGEEEECDGDCENCNYEI